LLDQLGWRRVEPLEQFEIELDAGMLARAIDNLQERAEHLVAQHFEEHDESLQVARRGLQVLAACRRVLSQVSEDAEAERS
jgi:hypothetical protein